MAYTVTTHNGSGFSTSAMLNAISGGLSRLFNAMANNSVGAARLARVEALRVKSDQELAAMGIRRDRIVHFVFKDILYL